MAGGKLSARQKMINLMYLIFIAMLALNMSKEVLSAFGLMNEKLTESNEAASQRNSDFMQGLAEKVNEQPAKYQPLKAQADQISILANDFNSYLDGLKGQMTSTVDDPKDYEIMDKGDYLDELFFIGDNLKPEGEEFLTKITAFREGVYQILATNPEMASIGLIKERMLDKNSDISRVIDRMFVKKLVNRSECKLDRRQKDIQISELGLDYLSKIDEKEKEFDDKMRHLSEEEVTLLNQLLNKRY